QGRLPEPTLPEGICQVFSEIGPPAALRIETRYRLRGDGLIMQMVRQHHDAQPRDEDLAWARAMFSELLGTPA
ncbi:MAG TPA: hypothetical protein VFY24_16625, partial [Azospira sp.]|nr:hypothetical protein [Azospira sp.]